MPVSIQINSNTDRVARKLANLAYKQVPFAASKALNETASVLEKRNRIEMKRTFDKPVRYTLNAFTVKRSNKRKLVAEVRRKDKPAGKHYLEVQQKGGVRPQKAVEKLIDQRVAYPGIVRSVLPVPGNGGATKNGNINMGEVNRALAGLNASFSRTAFTQNKQAQAQARRSQQKRPSQYFVKSNESGTSGGIYKRLGNRRVKKVFHISDSMPNYRPIYKFHPFMMKNARSYFPQQFKRQFRAAMRTAKLR